MRVIIEMDSDDYDKLFFAIQVFLEGLDTYTNLHVEYETDQII